MALFIPFKKFSGSINMLIDENILNNSIKNNAKPVLRFYGWLRPTLSLGRNQSIDEINYDYCKNHNIDIVRRPTGGRAVFHHQELTYSFITPINLLENGRSVSASYKEISEALVISMEKLGIGLSYPEHKKVSTGDSYCMAISTGSDLSYQNKKLIGSAQFRKKNYILQHGSILLNIDMDILAEIFPSKGIKMDFTTIYDINPALADIELLSDAIKWGFEKKFDLNLSYGIK